jgi:hypothetical protein
MSSCYYVSKRILTHRYLLDVQLLLSKKNFLVRRTFPTAERLGGNTSWAEVCQLERLFFLLKVIK